MHCCLVLNELSKSWYGYREEEASNSKVAVQESWMKEDLFVRPDGQPVIFLMGDVRERDKVPWLGINFWLYDFIKGEGVGRRARWSGSWWSFRSWCWTCHQVWWTFSVLSTSGQQRLLVRTELPPNRSFDLFKYRWTLNNLTWKNSLCETLSFCSYVLDCIRSGAILDNLQDYKVPYYPPPLSPLLVF